MMPLREKLHVRANVLWHLFQYLKPSTILLVSVLVSWMKFYNYGLAMYEGRSFPRMTYAQAVQTFTDLSVLPYAWWWAGAVLLEMFILSPLYLRFVVRPLAK